MSLLGLDFGAKRIGVARSDELNFMAHPVGFIPNENEQQVFQEVKKMADEFHIERIVVGLPKTMKGEVGPQAQKVLEFVQRLQNYLGCLVVTWDERLTTAQAERTLIDQDMSRAKRKKKRDAIAAEIMLQSYLDFSKQRET